MDTCIVLLDFGVDVFAVSKLGNKVLLRVLLISNLYYWPRCMLYLEKTQI